VSVIDALFARADLRCSVCSRAMGDPECMCCSRCATCGQTKRRGEACPGANLHAYHLALVTRCVCPHPFADRKTCATA
jgi:hypothetical protein